MAMELTDSVLNDLVREYLAGFSANNLAGKFGISRDVIVRNLKRRGVHIRNIAEQGKMGFAAHFEEMAVFYAGGESIKSIANRFNCSIQSVHSVLKANGVNTKRNSHFPKDSAVITDYKSGMTIKDVSEKYGIGTSSVHRIIKRAGVVANDYTPVVDMQTAVDLFNSGIGVGGVANILKTGSRSYLHKLFISNGIKTRNRSEQQFARMRRATAEERQALAKAAHDAVRGVKASPQALINRSKSRCKTVSKYERQLMHMLTERGVTTEPQLPIGPYNCDLASGTVAVEVFGGGWHWHGKHLAMTDERFRYILNAGWDLLVVPVNVWGCCLSPSVADYVAAYIKRANGNPTRRREYRVIWRGGECFTAGSLDDDYISIIPPFTNRRNPANGRYETVPR